MLFHQYQKKEWGVGGIRRYNKEVGDGGGAGEAEDQNCS